MSFACFKKHIGSEFDCNSQPRQLTYVISLEKPSHWIRKQLLCETKSFAMLLNHLKNTCIVT
jgi:hypothetical protein